MADHILLVDDDLHLQKSLSDFLRSKDFHVVQASNAERALELLELQTFDLILLDISMPGMGGLGFLREAFRNAPKQKCPVLVLTARSDLGAFFENMDVAGFLAKPCDGKIMVETINRILAASKSEAEGKRASGTALVIDSDSRRAEEIIGSLSENGYRSVRAISGPSAIEIIAQEKPDLILIFHRLVDMDGVQVTRLLRLLPSSAHARIAVFDDQDTDMSSLPTLPGVDYIAMTDGADLVHKALASGQRKST